MPTQNNPDSRKIIVPIWLAAQEFRDLYHALNDYSTSNNLNLDFNELLNSDSAKNVLINQGFDTEAAFAYLSALAKAGNDYHRIWSAPKGQTRR
jgi:hypothetical protein